MISSLVIDHLSARYELSTTINAGVTFIYCAYDDSRNHIQYIRVAISQLFRRMQCLPPSLQKLYQKHKDNREPEYEELISTFLAITQQFDRLFFVLDALDECAQECKLDLCRFLCDIMEGSVTSKPTHGINRGMVKILVMSRMDADIEQTFPPKAFPIEIQAAKVDKDIAIYVKAQVGQLSQENHLTLKKPALKSRILNGLTMKAGGMYVHH